ncbi:MAG: hypothetical protein IPF92_03640 [Myxococcales bacterium]|jgi:hypothetical protein|nr:hypothetical protein [Myxococcales bacterium]MBL0196644.1 hypothetical protein [Myxococcales bacterium]HQY63196.1 hypothetical protein [Polyangiaceae bacterium]
MRSLRAPLLALRLSLALALGVAALSAPRPARASISFAVAYDDMVTDSDAVAVVTALEHQSVWEENRIVTYTHLRVEEGIAGNLATGAETWVRTLGGSVGNIGQQVGGEPVFVQGKVSLIFARATKPGTVSVVARAQGQFPVLVDPATKRRSVMKNANCGLLVPRVEAVASTAPAPAGVAPRAVPTPVPTPTAARVVAVDALHGRSLEDVARDISAQWKRLHK